MLTIGIVSIGSDLTHAAKLYHAIVECCTISKELGGFGCEKDQDHPPAINVSLLPKNPLETEKSFHLTKYLGADFFAVAEVMDDDQLREITEKVVVKVFCLKKNQSFTDLAKEVSRYALETQITDSVRANRGNFAEAVFNKELKDFAQTISTRKSKIIGAITGAGPLAGAVYYDELASTALPHIGISYTTAPDKNDAILKLGPDFVPEYQKVMRLIDPFVDCHTIACNTAHSRIDDFKSVVTKPFLDIRDATLTFLKENFSPDNKNIILLGTPATMKTRLYHEKLIAAGYNIIEPTAEQLEIIRQVIYQVKGNIIKSNGAPFDLDNAKQRILNVVKEIRSANDDKSRSIPVLLGCTELNVPFTPAEISRHSLISTTSALVENSRVFSKTHHQNEYKNSALVKDSRSSTTMHNHRNEVEEFKEETLSQKSNTSSSGDEKPSLSPTLSPLRTKPVLNLFNINMDESESKQIDVSRLDYFEKLALGQILIDKALIDKARKRPREESQNLRSYIERRKTNNDESEVSEDDDLHNSKLIEMIKHLINNKKINEKIHVLEFKNKIQIVFPELQIIAKHNKILQLRQQFGNIADARFHVNRGYISCNLHSSQEAQIIKELVTSKGLSFQESGGIAR